MKGCPGKLKAGRPSGARACRPAALDIWLSARPQERKAPAKAKRAVLSVYIRELEIFRKQQRKVRRLICCRAPRRGQNGLL